MPKKIAYKDMSKSELEVAQFLNTRKLSWIYQHPVVVSDEKKRPRAWAPAFFLPEFGIFVEVCDKIKELEKYREKVYRKHSLPVIFVQYLNGKKEWQANLITQIKGIQVGRDRLAYVAFKEFITSMPR